MAKVMGSEANLTEDKMGAFLQDLWKFKADDWTWDFYHGVKAYNTNSAEGISAEDFLDCWKAWEI